jgi:predicted O-methyltransferase YrrM
MAGPSYLALECRVAAAGRLLPMGGRICSTIPAMKESSDVILSPEHAEYLERIGYGALCLARGAPEAVVVSLDHDPEMQAEAVTWLERGGVAERVELFCGEALDLLPTLAGPFELAYVDADKIHLRRYLDLLLAKIVVGGLVVVDNLLWKGRVAGDDVDGETEAIRAFNGYFMMHPQLCSVLLPLGDGVGVAAKTRPLVTEMGGPF